MRVQNRATCDGGNSERLSHTEFGARPRRSAEQALMIPLKNISATRGEERSCYHFSLMEHTIESIGIYYNKMTTKRLGVLEFFVKWIDNFCSNLRTPSLAFLGFGSEV